MVPCISLKTRPVTSSQPPKTISAARVRSVRALRRVSHRPATSATRAVGSSQEIWVPKTLPNIRVSPVAPPKLPPWLPPPPPLPVPPKSRPRPL